MACTRFRGVRVEDELIEAARQHEGLADASISTLIRVGLAVLADLDDLGIPVASLRGLYGDRSHRRRSPYSRPELTQAQLQQRGEG